MKIVHNACLLVLLACAASQSHNIKKAEDQLTGLKLLAKGHMSCRFILSRPCPRKMLLILVRPYRAHTFLQSLNS